MQAISPLTAADFLAPVATLLYKIEIYDDTGTWVDLSSLAGVNYLADQGFSLEIGGNGADPTPIAPKWSAVLHNWGGVFHPWHPTSTYKDYLRIGRKVRISTGLASGGTDYYYPRLIGYITKRTFDSANKTVTISGSDYMQTLADYALNWPDNYWGDVAVFDSISSSGVTGTEIYTEGDAADTLAEANDPGDWTGALTVESVADAGAGSVYALKFTRELAGSTDYAHESNVGVVTVGEQYFISFKGKPVTGTGWRLSVYQTVGGTLTLIRTFYLDGDAAWTTHSARITALKTGALEMRVSQEKGGAAGDECRVDQISTKLYEAAWNTYQLPDDCNGPYYVTLGQFAQAGNSDIFSPSIGTHYIIGVRYKRVSGTGATWLGAYQEIASVLTLVAKIPLTSSAWMTAFGSFDATSAATLQLRLVSEDGEEDDETRLAWISIQEYGAGATEHYEEADALDTENEAANVTNWTALSGCTIDHESDTTGGDSYVAVFKRTGSFNEQVGQGSRDDDGNWDGWLYNDTTKAFRFDVDRVVENGTDNLNIYYYTSQTLENVLADILVRCRLYDDQAAALAAMDYTATGITIKRVWFESGTTALEAVKQICERANYRFWFAYDGTPTFKPTVETTEPSLSFDFTSLNALAGGGLEENRDRLRNSISIDGAEQEPFAATDDQRDSKFTGAVVDEDSVEDYGLKTEPIQNNLFQDQASIDAALADLLADLKDPKWYGSPKAGICAAPLEVGDKISWREEVGAYTILATGIIRQMQISQLETTFSCEITDEEVVDNLLIDGELEEWTSATALENWDDYHAGTSSINREATEKYEGNYALRIDVDASNNKAGINQTLKLQPSTQYQVSFRYKTGSGKTCTPYCGVYIGGANYYLQSDGSWKKLTDPGASDVYASLTNTAWTLSTFVFTTPAAFDDLELYWGVENGEAASSSIYIDDVVIDRYLGS